MGICINYMIRKQTGEPFTAKVTNNFKEFEAAARDHGYASEPSRSFYGENDTHKVKFSKTAGPRTERGVFMNDHIRLCERLHELNTQGLLEVVYDESGFLNNGNLGTLRKNYSSFKQSTRLVEAGLSRKGWKR